MGVRLMVASARAGVRVKDHDDDDDVYNNYTGDSRSSTPSAC